MFSGASHLMALNKKRVSMNIFVSLNLQFRVSAFHCVEDENAKNTDSIQNQVAADEQAHHLLSRWQNEQTQNAADSYLDDLNINPEPEITCSNPPVNMETRKVWMFIIFSVSIQTPSRRITFQNGSISSSSSSFSLPLCGHNQGNRSCIWG